MVTVKLKVENKVIWDYFHYLYPPDVATGHLKVTASDILGKLLCSHCRVSPKPVHDPDGPEVLVLDLPGNDVTQVLECKFVHYSVADTSAINMAASAVFDLDFRGYYRKGEDLGFRKQDIVESFILSRKLFSGDCFDALHKRVYRHDQRTLGKLTHKFIRKCYYIDESIDTQGFKDLEK